MKAVACHLVSCQICPGNSNKNKQSFSEIIRYKRLCQAFSDIGSTNGATSAIMKLRVGRGPPETRL